MKWGITDPRVYLQVISIAVLIVGLGSAVVIYERTGKESPEVLGYEEGDGTVYPVNPGDSKTYERSMELYGGKANLLADELRRWFVGLWHGTPLAVVVACASVLASFCFFFAATHPGAGTGRRSRDKPPRGEPK